jgi:hypothetical protein
VPLRKGGSSKEHSTEITELTVRDKDVEDVDLTVVVGHNIY